ncbi:MAG: hypothetical protein V7727_02065 [Sneathiella sp.]
MTDKPTEPEGETVVLIVEGDWSGLLQAMIAKDLRKAVTPPKHPESNIALELWSNLDQGQTDA